MFYNIQTLVFAKRSMRAYLAFIFALAYACIEYYFIRDPSFGLNPVLFSLIYPYHLAMAAVFGMAAYLLLSEQTGVRRLLPSLILTVALFSTMLVVEDFMWFTLRALAPIQGDLNAGKFIVHGEWSTQFIGSVDAYFTAIPNWYFLSIIFSSGVIFLQRAKPQLTAPALRLQ